MNQCDFDVSTNLRTYQSLVDSLAATGLISVAGNLLAGDQCLAVVVVLLLLQCANKLQLSNPDEHAAEFCVTSWTGHE